MPNFQVPQFIEQKAKIIGPLTLGQFLYVAGAAVIGFITYNFFNFYLFFFITSIAAGLAIALAFVKINGEEMSKILASSFSYLFKPRTYVWQRSFAQKTLEVGDVEDVTRLRQLMGLGEKIKSVALNIATGRVFWLQNQKLKQQKDRFQTVTFITGERRLAKRVDFATEEKPGNENLPQSAKQNPAVQNKN